ncbi:MAG: hypothetical protein ACXABD_18435 [Candidatus Thorarchaeota archaeon]|jgi:hypothetical protein
MKRIAITACPYSGTKYTALLLRKFDLKIGHEWYGDDGVVSWQHIHMSKSTFVADGFSEDMVLLHQIAHPLMVISRLRQITISYTHPRTGKNIWEFIKSLTKALDTEWDIDEAMRPEDKRRGLLIWMNLWYWWNLKGSMKADASYRIENIQDRWCWFRDMLSIGSYPYPKISKTINRKKTRRILSWNDLYEEDTELTMKILDLAEAFGYEQIPVDYLDDPFYEFPEKLELELARVIP